MIGNKSSEVGHWNKDALAEPAMSERDLQPFETGDATRLWGHLTTCVALIEAQMRARLRDQFDVTLPRFHLMAQLDKAPRGLSMGELSRRLMVSNGNVTGVVERLVGEGLISRTRSPDDRRSHHVRLTPTGRNVFRRMAANHDEWIAELLSDLDPADLPRLFELLGQVEASVRHHAGNARSLRSRPV